MQRRMREAVTQEVDRNRGNPMSREPDYVLGHSRAELDRLTEQSTFYAAATEDMMRRAGIGPGMRVLEVGSLATTCLTPWSDASS